MRLKVLWHLRKSGRPLGPVGKLGRHFGRADQTARGSGARYRSYARQIPQAFVSADSCLGAGAPERPWGLTLQSR